MWEANISQNDLELKNANIIPISKVNFSKLFKITKEHMKITELITQNLSRKRFVTTIVLDEQYVVKLKIDYSDDLERFEDFKREFFKN